MKKLKSIEIVNSSFFQDNFKIVFSDKLNCIMGGRGTGKSTLLYMIKATLDGEAEYHKTVYDILKNNLGDGKIILNMEDGEGRNYKIVKTFNDEPQPYLLPDENHIAIEKIIREIDCDIYEQNAIEEIGKNKHNRLDLIDKMSSKEIKEPLNAIESIKIDLNHNAQSIKTENAKLKQMQNNLKEYENAEDDLNNHKKDPPDGINDEEKKIFEVADQNEKIRLAEKRFVKKIVNDMQKIRSYFVDQMQEINSFLSDNSNIENFINKDILKPLVEEINVSLNKILNAYDQDYGILDNMLSKINQLTSKLDEKHEKQQNEFVQLKQKFEEHKQYYSRYNKLSKRVDDKIVLQKEFSELKKKGNKLKSDRKKLVTRFNGKKKDVFNKRLENVKKLNDQFSGSIKITLTFSGIYDEFEEALKKSFRGSGIRYNVIVPNIVQNFTPDNFAQIVHTKDSDTLKNLAGIDNERSAAIFNVLYESEGIYSMESIYSPDLPEFLLKIDARNDTENRKRDYYKKSDELSTGQRCTTVLPIVFAVSNNPLIIDQPEDNLDNKYISETIHKIIREQKNERQLLFITHNPNIPVLSGAEKNVFLNYSEKKSFIEKEGNVETVKEYILNLLEGGKEAFDERLKLYGR